MTLNNIERDSGPGCRWRRASSHESTRAAARRPRPTTGRRRPPAASTSLASSAAWIKHDRPADRLAAITSRQTAPPPLPLYACTSHGPAPNGADEREPPTGRPRRRE
jgi:hypothetical protein